MSATEKDFYPEIDLPASKSIHNRVLILDSLYDLNLEITNPSHSDDTILLNLLLRNSGSILDCQNAGTVLRFLTAFCAVARGKTILSGSSRMLERPVGDLVDALKKLGVSVDYKGKPGYPPIEISGGLKKGGRVTMNGNVSSQFISALLMIGPKLEGGLQIAIEGRISSRPYINMTVDLMLSLGFDVQFAGNTIHVHEWTGLKLLQTVEIEPDWSAAAFWFQIIALSVHRRVLLKGLKSKSLQGDSILWEWAGRLGIKITRLNEGVLLQNSNKGIPDHTEWDLSAYPDLAPSIIVLSSALKKKANFRGLKSLSIKESDRTLALQKELKKCGVAFEEVNGEWVLDATGFELRNGTRFENYNDHRIAMALATLAVLKPINMDNPEVVNKSYPGFWKDVEGFLSYDL